MSDDEATVNPTSPDAVGAPVERPDRPLPQRWTGIVQAHCSGGFVAFGDYMAAMDEIERLRDVLTRIQQWADAYPLEQFPEVLRQDWQRANALLAKKGISMSAMSASNMRHVLSGVRAMVAEGWKA